MTNNKNGHRDKNLVVIQLSGGNDYLNTLVPYQDGLYYDFRPNMGLKGDDLIPLDDRLAFNSNMGPFKTLFDQGKMAVLMGIGYPEPSRSHFRSMDIWHTAEPFTSSSEGWLGKANSLIDPEGRNPITTVNFGRGLPRALALQGVSVASVGALESYGLYTGLAGARNGDAMLDTISRIYQPMADGGFPSRRILETGRGMLDGADLLREAPANYTSDVEYPEDNPIAQSLKGIAQVMSADLGTRIYYAAHGSFDTHTNELVNHALLWDQVSTAVACFWEDVGQLGKGDETVIWMFSEFGRRIADNGAGTDHGSGGAAFVIGDSVKGGLYGDYPKLALSDQLDGDVRFNTDFREVYATLLEDVLGIESEPVLKQKFSTLDLIRN
ncbi:MAG: DUF1501 domain-containing protein [Chloroflexi bacterium]|nr:DUF1501 domain-containing protein [Chloroflexota bacterium]MCI0835242.1 DUF1501 domain-containing protein [Chloroflexota bacterium]MCI0837386.1 DUF1501 domain-containing protein [Chloroflexota bacterium]MCI0851971.1 DUF1501 domain-containing protein [Chloroflexota bacterium]MCI0871478.1 DUF1501 domain-containing protein [Chloroflexota bacterium]